MPRQEIQHPSGDVKDTVVIASGASLSGVLSLVGKTLTDIIMPSAWTAANLTFQYSDSENGTFVDMYDDAGTEYLVVAGASRGISLDPRAFVGKNFLKIRSGTSGTPVNQGAARTLTCILAGLE